MNKFWDYERHYRSGGDIILNYDSTTFCVVKVLSVSIHDWKSSLPMKCTVCDRQMPIDEPSYHLSNTKIPNGWVCSELCVYTFIFQRM